MLQRRLESQKQRRQRRLLLERSSGGNRSSRCRANYLPGLLIVLLVLLQNFELHMCRQLMGAAANRRKDMDTDEQLLPAAAAVASSMEKRAIAATTVSQPEEIFSAPNDAADMSYDEYPMIVPKRAALLLDRLMVALHHALENEREGHRIGDFYANKNMMQLKPNEYKNALEPLQATEEGDFHMYSDDDPGVMLDYDFKDINQINRATGETLMAKSFQRRAGGIGPAASSATAAASSAHATNGGKASAAAAAGPGPGPGARRIHHHVANGGGRMYWRCYFNAVSCF
ncbi:uncharacterized protein LOC115759261 [Drosophila novamexicana]|uniref:uncharacterized protein LOC115759261 n=1 Tax=Drosophila novamexicana TaxID=47314 RepID=UPI0011E5DB91|nr:uncharacterized protein LOC115759261 [Drosophila novamexicana]